MSGWLKDHVATVVGGLIVLALAGSVGWLFLGQEKSGQEDAKQNEELSERKENDTAIFEELEEIKRFALEQEQRKYDQMVTQKDRTIDYLRSEINFLRQQLHECRQEK